MSKGLDLIKRQQPEIIDGFPTGNIFIGVTKEELTELEKELKALEQLEIMYSNCVIEGAKQKKALEIIKEKQVDIHNFTKSKTCEEYNGFVHWLGYKGKLTKEEYDLVREVLL